MATATELDELDSYAYSETELVADVCRESFYEFVQEFWDQISEEDLVLNWHIEYLCDELQYMAELVFENQPKEYDLIVNIPPGTTKSTICSIMFPAWVWTRMPRAQMICGSHTHELTLDLSRKCRDIIESEKYMECFPGLKLRPDQNTKGHFANTRGGMRFCCTVGGKTPTGKHAHFLLIDDPIDPDKAFSEAELSGANRWMRQTLPTRKVQKAVTPIILIMQRLHQNDPSGERLARTSGGRVKHICLPADVTYDIKPAYLKKYYREGLLDPLRLSRKVLNDARADLGNYGFAGQFGQNPIPLGGGMFKTERIVIERRCPPLSHFRLLVRYWDNAGTKDDGTFTVGVLMGTYYRTKDPEELPEFWVINVIRGQWESAERERIKKQTARIDGKKVTIAQEQEPGSGGKESAHSTRRTLALQGHMVLLDKPVGDKTKRADPFSVQVNDGYCHIVQADWNYEYVEELKFFPNSKYKDQVDASSGAYAYLTYKKPRRVGAIR